MKKLTKSAIVSASALILFSTSSLANSVIKDTGNNTFRDVMIGKKAVKVKQEVRIGQQYFTGEKGNLVIKLKNCSDIQMKPQQVLTIVKIPKNQKECPIAKDLVKPNAKSSTKPTSKGGIPFSLPLIIGLGAGALAADNLHASP